MFSEARPQLYGRYGFPIPEVKSYRIELPPKPETELDVPLHYYVEAAQRLFPDLFGAGQAMREGKKTIVEEWLPRLKESMPVFYYHFGLDRHPQRLLVLMDAFGVDEEGRLPIIDNGIDFRIIDFFHQFSLTPGNLGDKSTLILLPGVEAEDSQTVPYLSAIKDFYGHIITVRQPQTDWYNELAEASILALNLARKKDQGLQEALPKQLDVAGYSHGGRYIQSMILRMAYADLQWGTKLLVGHTGDVRTTAVISAASGMSELPLRSQIAVQGVDWIADKFGFWLAKKMQMLLVPDSGEYEIGRSIHITRGQQIEDWWRIFHEEINLQSGIPTIEAFLKGLELPEGWLFIVASKADEVVGPARDLATLLGVKWHPLVGLRHRDVPYDTNMWRELRKPASQRQWGARRKKPGGQTLISPSSS